MKPKRYIKIEKLQRRTSHIKDFHIIIKLLYPYRQTINKYSHLTSKMPFTTAQKELLKTTIHSLTIINEMYRDTDKYGRLYSTREDLTNAVFMLQNELDLQGQIYLLKPNLRWFYGQLEQHFGGLTFTRRQVSNKLIKSKSTCYRHLTELVDRELLEITGKSKNTYQYYFIEKR